MKSVSNQKGFSAVEIVLVLVVLLVIAAVGVLIYKDHSKTKPAATAPTAKTTTPADPYAGWKTYKSTVSAFSFEYPATWYVPDMGLTGNSGRISSVKPAGTHDNAINYHLDLDVDQYASNIFGSGIGSYAGDNLKLIQSIPFQTAGHKLFVNIYQKVDGGSFEDSMYVMDKAPASINTHDNYSDLYVTTTDGSYRVGVSASLNNDESGFPSGTDLNQDFVGRADVAEAELIMKSIQL